MGMSERDFGYMTPRVFFNKLKGFAKKKNNVRCPDNVRKLNGLWTFCGESDEVEIGSFISDLNTHGD